ncbi:unnamed protein product [Effrenium voratum]|uniref:BD-FAE-like domain-containing protein n=1 Tax=Effrenium voratum TaxID=2562239 RepID=A0AA36JMU4_9DINO|nr:unnamed protein product [Effrenium voratum]
MEDHSPSRGFSWPERGERFGASGKAARDTESRLGSPLTRSPMSSQCLDLDNLMIPTLKKRRRGSILDWLGEPLERPLRAARPQSSKEASLMSEIYARIARDCGRPLLDDVWRAALSLGRANCHERFDASLENATRVFETIVANDQQDITSRNAGPESQREQREQREQRATVWLSLAMLLSAAALACVPLVGLQALAAFLVYLGVVCAGAKACKRRRSAVLFAAWCLGEATLGLLISSGLVFAGSTLMADESGSIEHGWLLAWRVFCANCALSVLSFAAVLVLIPKVLKSKATAAPQYIPGEQSQVIGACTEEPLPLSQPHPEPKRPTKILRILLKAISAACAFCMVACTVIFLFLHVFPPGESMDNLELPACTGCFCANNVSAVNVDRNVVYGMAHSRREGRQQELVLDVYHPSNRSADRSPAVLLIHGGNFMGSDKRNGIMVSEARHFANAGFVAFSMDYRLEGSNYLVEAGAVRAAVHDAKAAVRFIARRAEFYGVDASRIVAWGESAGGITATSMNSLGSEGDSGSPGYPSNVSAAVGISSTMWPFLVGAPSNQQRNVTPWFNVHGQMDNVVFPFLAVMTHTYLLARGMPEFVNRIVWVPGGVHVPWGPGAELDVSAQLRPVVMNFLTEVMDLQKLC